MTETRPLPTGPSEVHDGEILARGVPIGQLIGVISFIDMLFFQAQARYPSEAEARMMDAYLVSLCEHGVTSPSTHGARVAASVRVPFAACAVNFLTAAMGIYHFGALENAMLQTRLIEAEEHDISAFVDRKIERRERLWGYGHRFHKTTEDRDLDDRELLALQECSDPRVRRLVALADELAWEGRYLKIVRAVGHTLFERKQIPINIDGCAAGLLLDMGFDPSIAMLFVALGRLPNIARLYTEEQSEAPNRFVALADRTDPHFNRTVDREQTAKPPAHDL
ncbi:MAG: hypothetical protein H6810_12780 [Phycisphaeraceae bacterium]|nr:MAG: hypothetical protein H6810_12780 [Phycisphaeraceae bacterium]